MQVQRKSFIRMAFLLLLCCWCVISAAQADFNRIEPQNLQFMPQPFYVTYNAVTAEPEKNIFQKLGSGFLNAMQRLRTRTRVVYGDDPNGQNQLDSSISGPFQGRRPLIQRFRERIKDRRTISTTTMEPPLEYYGAMSPIYQINAFTAPVTESTAIV